MQLDVINIEGKKSGRTIDLPDEIFAAEPNNHAIWLAVKQYLAAQRQGTHKVKGRSEVRGSTRKLHKQKGTGGSRKGNIRNPLYRGGGAIFGPEPHEYNIKVNRKVKDLARIGALSSKASENKIWILEDACMNMEKPGAKKFLSMLNNLNSGTRSLLFISHEFNENVYKSLRNLTNVSGTVLSDMNTYDILDADGIVFTESSAKVFADGMEDQKAAASDEVAKS